MKPIDVGTVNIARPLADAVVTVRLTVPGRVRLWLTKSLIRLAVWISGGDLVIKTGGGADV